MKLSPCILSISYLGPIQYYSKLSFSNKVWIEQHENYCKQSFRNRCEIYGPNGLQQLVIPVKKENSLKIPIRKVRIDYKTDWQKNHLKSIETAYSSSPFFDFFIDELLPYYQKKDYENLFDFNFSLQKMVFDFLEIYPKINLTLSYQKTESLEIDDFRETIHPKTRMREVDNSFNDVPYDQVFKEKHGFIPNLSILDLIFNLGPASLSYLESCIPLKDT